MNKYSPAGDTDSVQEFSGVSASPLVCRNHQFSVMEPSDFMPEPPNCLMNTNNNASLVKRVRQGMSKVFLKNKNNAREPLLNQMQGNQTYEFSMYDEFDKNNETRSSWDMKTNNLLEKRAAPVFQSPTSVAAPTSHFFDDRAAPVLQSPSPTSVAAPTSHFFDDSDEHQPKEEEPAARIYAEFSHSLSWSSASSISSAAASTELYDVDEYQNDVDEWKYMYLPDHNAENDPLDKEEKDKEEKDKEEKEEAEEEKKRGRERRRSFGTRNSIK